MASVAALRDALQVRLGEVAGLRAYDVVQSQVNAPAAMVRPSARTRDDYEGNVTWVFLVDIFVSTGGGIRTAQNSMDAYLPGGANDAVAALEADDTLAGIADSVTAELVPESYGFSEVAGVIFLAAQIRVEVLV